MSKKPQWKQKGDKGFGKNIQGVKDMLDGNFQRKLVVGQYNPTEEVRKIGDTWTDSEGYEWEQKEGYKMKKSSMPARGMFDKVCKDCDSPCTKSFDKDTHIRMGRCYKCQTTFELDLQFMKIGKNNNKHFFWLKLQNLMRWQAMDKEALLIIEQLENERNSVSFDKTVANALANSEVEMSINKNKN